MRDFVLSVALLAAGCFSSEPEGLAPAPEAPTTVVYDFYAKPLPNIPLPNDLATRYDKTSATGRRLNASMVTPTQFNTTVRRLVDQLDGWGVLQTIQVPFSGPLDVESILKGHRDVDYAFGNDVIYVIDITKGSPSYGQPVALNVGNGNFSQVLERREYWKNDVKNFTLGLLFDERDEDKNGNGVLDLGGDKNGDGVISEDELSEDADADGVMDKPNRLPGETPLDEDLAGRADALMTFYEVETNTLLVKPMVPLRERTTYAVVVTNRILDINGKPVGSPFPFKTHSAQAEALKDLGTVLPEGLAMDEVAFAFSFTTQTIGSNWIPVRDGLYGHGVQSHLAEEYPAEIDSMFPLRGDKEFFGDVKNPYVMYTEQWGPAFNLIQSQIQNADPTKVETKELVASQQYVDYNVIGSYISPQLFPRESEDAPGVWLPLNEQAWPEDLDRTKAPARGEKVYYWIFMPRREVSKRGSGGHVPIALLGHGYTGNRFDAAVFAGHFAKHGIATIAIDNVSHGINVDPELVTLAHAILDPLGMKVMVEAVLTDRAVDQNNDGLKDSGADFWSTYLFHTRDAVRQSALDYMQLIRIIRSFDGKRTWDFDTNGDGKPDLAGDFDGDGKVDIGANSIMGMVGGSLGGMMATYMGSIEPELEAIVPIAAGGVLAELGVRSQQGGVREAFILRTLCPIFTGTPDPETGKNVVETIVPDLNETAELTIGTLDDVKPGDTVVVENLKNGIIGCANVAMDGTWRLGVESDLKDPMELRLYAGPVLVGDHKCTVKDGATPKQIVGQVAAEYEFQGETFAVGTPLLAMAEGFGMQRGSPDLRRLFGLGQLISDPADPAVVAVHMQKEPLYYPGTDQKTGTHMFQITTAGDMSVPVNGGMAIARAAGTLPYLESDERYGKPANQVLLDTYTAEAVHNVGRYHDKHGNPVHIDVENLSGGNDPWKDDEIPRLETPLRLWGPDTVCASPHDPDFCGGFTASIFPWPRPDGQHGFSFPGGFIDRARDRCKSECVEEDPAVCGCETLEVFDIGFYLFNISGRFISSGGTELPSQACMSSNDCSFMPAPPEPRDPSTLD